MNASFLDEALRAAGIPILGVSIPSDDKASWRVDFAPEATPTHQQQAAELITAYTEPMPATLLDRHADQRVGDKALLATAQALWECIPAPTMTKAQLRARAKAIFKTL